MTSKAVARPAFSAHHRHDRGMIAAIVFAIWLAIIAGFGIDMVKRAHQGTLNFPLIMHLHVLAHGGWLLLLEQMPTGETREGIHRASRV